MQLQEKKASVTLWLLLYSLSTSAATANELVEMMQLQHQNKKIFADTRDYCKQKTKSLLALFESKVQKQIQAANDLYIPTGALLSIFTTLAMLPEDKIDEAFEEVEKVLSKYLNKV